MDVLSGCLICCTGLDATTKVLGIEQSIESISVYIFQCVIYAQTRALRRAPELSAVFHTACEHKCGKHVTKERIILIYVGLFDNVTGLCTSRLEFGGKRNLFF